MIKLNKVFKSFEDYDEKVLSFIKSAYFNAEWLNDSLSFTKQRTIYDILMLKYGRRYIRYDNEKAFINMLIYDLLDLLPDIFYKQQVFIKNNLSSFLSEAKNRAIVFENNFDYSKDYDNNTKMGNSGSPTNLVITKADELENMPVTSANLSNVKFIENYNSKNSRVMYNLVNDLIKTLNSDFTLRIDNFMKLLNKHFVSVSVNCLSDDDGNCKFHNGYYVEDVDYYCEENKELIESLKESKQDNLIAGQNIKIEDNVISATIELSDPLTAGENIEIVDNKINLKKDFKITINDFSMEYKVDRLGHPSLNFIGNYAGGEKITSIYPGIINVDETKIEYDGVTIYNYTDLGYLKFNENVGYSYYGNQLEEFCFYHDENNGIVRFKDLENVATSDQLSSKQNKLVAGDNIKIEGDVISATNSSSSEVVVYDYDSYVKDMSVYGGDAFRIYYNTVDKNGKQLTDAVKEIDEKYKNRLIKVVWFCYCDNYRGNQYRSTGFSRVNEYVVSPANVNFKGDNWLLSTYFEEPTSGPSIKLKWWTNKETYESQPIKTTIDVDTNISNVTSITSLRFNLKLIII